MRTIVLTQQRAQKECRNNDQSTIVYLLQQRTLLEHLVYELVREFDEERKRVYPEMHTEDWWWETQV